jgi:hypothetical protein
MRPRPGGGPLAALAALAVLPALAACEADAPAERRVRTAPIFHGTRDPQTVPLSDGQKLAIGWLHGNGAPAAPLCTATLVGPRLVVTARHCVEDVFPPGRVAFGVGLRPRAPRATFAVAALHLHPTVDAALLVLEADAAERVPEIAPIEPNRASPADLRGERLDTAGYGQTHDGSDGRWFAAVWLAALDDELLHVDGRGQQGLCFGDSGGPLLGPGPVVLGVESGGDPSCVDKDRLTRLDPLAAWVDEVQRGAPAAAPCGGGDGLGRCLGAVFEWCEGGRARRHDCTQDGRRCAWSATEGAFACVVAACAAGGSVAPACHPGLGLPDGAGGGGDAAADTGPAPAQVAAGGAGTGGCRAGAGAGDAAPLVLLLLAPALWARRAGGCERSGRGLSRRVPEGRLGPRGSPAPPPRLGPRVSRRARPGPRVSRDQSSSPSSAPSWAARQPGPGLRPRW